MIHAACRNPDGQIQIFRPDAHAQRCAHSASFLSITKIPESHFVECIHAAVAGNASYVPPHGIPAALYIRPILFGSGCQIGLEPPDEYTFCVFVQPHVALHGNHPIAALVLDEFDRAAPRGTGSAKVGGNYSPITRWLLAARPEGFGVLLHLDSLTQTQIDEFSTSAFIVIKPAEGRDDIWTLVVPDSVNVIRSITSESCLAIARSLGWEVEIRPVCEIRYPTVATVRRGDVLLTRRRFCMRSLQRSKPSLLQELQQGLSPSIPLRARRRMTSSSMWAKMAN